MDKNLWIKWVWKKLWIEKPKVNKVRWYERVLRKDDNVLKEQLILKCLEEEDVGDRR